jgi:hypothetical protein
MIDAPYAGAGLLFFTTAIPYTTIPIVSSAGQKICVTTGSGKNREKHFRRRRP